MTLKSRYTYGSYGHVSFTYTPQEHIPKPNPMLNLTVTVIP